MLHTHRRLRLTGMLASASVAALMLAGCGGGSETAQSGDPADFVLNGWPMPDWLVLPDTDTLAGRSDPEGHEPTWFTEVQMTQAEVDEVRELGLKAAFVNWDDVPFNKAFEYGADRAFAELGIDVVARTNFEFDAAKASADIQNVLALDPDIILTGVLDTAQWPAILQPAVDAGVTVVLYSQGAEGWKSGEELCTVVDVDTQTFGSSVADGIHKQYPDGANVGVIRWSFNHPAVVARDKGFMDQLATYPNLEVVADLWMDDPNAADAVASALLTRAPEVEVIYAPWDSPPAEGILSALRAAGREDVGIATLDLGVTSASEIRSGGPIFHASGSGAYEAGRTMAVSASKCVLGGESKAEVPPYVIFPAFGADASNLEEAWLYMHGPDIPLPTE